MKKILLLLLLFSSIIYAGEKELTKAALNYVNLEVAFIDFRESKDLLSEESVVSLEMLYTSEELSDIFNNYLKTYNISESEYQSSKIISVNGLPYLRSYSEDGYVSTTALEPVYSKERGGIALKTRGVTCTTKACATDDGCIPAGDGKSCTSCLWDCTKSVTEEQFPRP